MFRSISLAAIVSVVVTTTAQAGQVNEHWSVIFSERTRIETWDNAMSLNDSAADSRTYTRSRTQLGTTWTPAPGTVFGLRFADEFRYYLAPKNIDFHLNEVFVDNLFLKSSLPGYSPLTFTVGRQDIMLGEGFIVMDGTPLDGSRSIYFNAVRLDWTIRPDHQLTAFMSRQVEIDDWLPIIHEQDQAMVEQPETGFVLHYSGKCSRGEVQGYFVQKRSSDNAVIPFNSTVSILGGRIKQPVLKSIDLTAVMEAGYQFGERGDADRSAVGGYGYLQYRPGWNTPRSCLPTSLSIGLIYLSGDDPNTDKWEGWDPMFGRWPKWSESFIYTQVKEEAVAWWTNLVSLNAEARFNLTSNVDLRVAFHHLTAPQAAEDSSAFPGGTGTARGELFIGKLSYKFDQRWSGHLLLESLDPGSYYFGGADDYAWIRAELTYQY